MSEKPIGFRSSTGWEKSHFGGFTRVLTDFPFIKVPDDCKINPSSKTELAWYESNKLLKIFLLVCTEVDGGVQKLFKSADREPTMVMKYDRKVGGVVPKPMVKMTTNTEAMKEAMRYILPHQSELAPLFNEYREFITDSSYEFLFDIEESEKKKGEGEGEGEGEGKKKKGEKEKGEGDGKGKGKPEPGDGEPGEPGEGTPADGEGQDNNEKEDDAPGYDPFEGLTQAEFDELMDELEKQVKAETNKSTFTPHSGSKDKVGNIKTSFTRKVKFNTIKPRNTPTKLSQDEALNANTLVNMLDISWESDKDIVKSLRMGKIDLSKIAEVPAGNVAVYQREMEEQTTRPFSICILMDESGSMGGFHSGYKDDPRSRSEIQYSLAKSLYAAFSQIIPQDKMYIYGHTGDSTPQVYTYHDPFNPSFMTTIDDVKRRSFCQNYDGPVIEAVHKRVREYSDDRIIFLVLSDGQPSGNGYGGYKHIEELKQIVESARRDEFVTVSIGIQYSGNDMYQYGTVVNNLSEMPKKVSHVLNKVVKTEFQ